MATNIFTNQTADGLGSVLTSGDAAGHYALTLSGYLDGAFCSILADISGGTDYVQVGSLSNGKPASLVILPAGAKVTCRLEGAKANTNITVLMG
jgi:hypothetical protein